MREDSTGDRMRLCSLDLGLMSAVPLVRFRALHARCDRPRASSRALIMRLAIVLIGTSSAMPWLSIFRPAGLQMLQAYRELFNSRMQKIEAVFSTWACS